MALSCPAVNQQTFQSLHIESWRQFEQWLDCCERGRHSSPKQPEFDEAEVAPRYRTLCQHLALARDRQYSPALVERLNRLVIRGHQFLYGSRPEAGPAVLRFFARDFAAAVRTQWRVVALSSALFFGPLLSVAGLTHGNPDIVHMLMSAEQVADYEQMYDPQRGLQARDAPLDAYMLGHYIWNNIRIGFQTFAGGLLFGLGTLFFLIVNGVLIGATAGYLLGTGRGTVFLSFVSGHSALELTGIVLMGAGGMMLGAALLFPGRSTRVGALRANARAAVPLVCGAGVLLALAALVEAFWSPVGTLSPLVKYGVGAALWCLVGAYFVFAGRQRDA